MKQKQSKDIVLPALVGALYVAISLLFAPLSFGAVQVRFSELFNHLCAYNKRYVYAVIIGCFITNLFSPLGLPDVIFGTTGTIIGTYLTWYFGRKTDNVIYKSIIATICQLPGTLLVGIELTIITKVPFWATWGSVAAGEMVSMIIGGFIVDLLAQKIDFKNGKVYKHEI